MSQPVGKVPVQTGAYREGDQIIEWGKVKLRPDQWDFFFVSWWI